MSNAGPVKMLKINPGAYPEVITSPQDLKTLQGHVGGFIQCTYPWEQYNVALVCDEEGKYDGAEPNRGLKYGDCGRTGDDKEELYDIVFGSFLIAGNDKSGNFRDLTDEEIEFFQERFKYPEMFFKTSGKFIAVPYEPEQEIER